MSIGVDLYQRSVGDNLSPKRATSYSPVSTRNRCNSRLVLAYTGVRRNSQWGEVVRISECVGNSFDLAGRQHQGRLLSGVPRRIRIAIHDTARTLWAPTCPRTERPSPPTSAAGRGRSHRGPSAVGWR